MAMLEFAVRATAAADGVDDGKAGVDAMLLNPPGTLEHVDRRAADQEQSKGRKQDLIASHIFQ